MGAVRGKPISTCEWEHLKRKLEPEQARVNSKPPTQSMGDAGNTKAWPQLRLWQDSRSYAARPYPRASTLTMFHMVSTNQLPEYQRNFSVGYGYYTEFKENEQKRKESFILLITTQESLGGKKAWKIQAMGPLPRAITDWVWT